MIRNTQTSFGWMSKTLHWLMAILLPLLFAMGLYMTSLDYYDPWYHRLPSLHKSIGLLVFSLLLIRFFWMRANPKPKPLQTHKNWEKKLSSLIQKIFYLLILVITVSGYFISTAKGKNIAFFNLFEIPAAFKEIKEDTADFIGDFHEAMAIILVILIALHVLAALKHHFIDKDITLTRMAPNLFNQRNKD